MKRTRSRILIDTNIPVYAAGRQHAVKAPAIRVLELAARNASTFFTDAEVLQEMLHRYIALKIWHESRSRFSSFAALMSGRIESVMADDVQIAADLADQYVNLSARDLIHVAIMKRVGCSQIVTADAGFDRIHGVQRLDPMLVEEWADTVTESP